MDYKVRKLNVLDIRYMARILKELEMSKEDFTKTIGEIFTSATKLSKDKSNSDNVSSFIGAIIPALDGLITLFADSDSFWNFFASLLSIEYKELENIGISEVKDVITAIIADEQVISFFTSISKTEQSTMIT